MTLLNPTATGRKRYTSAAAGSAATHWIRKVWEVVWLLAVPLLVGYFVYLQTGDAWGVIPAFWLDDPDAVFMPVAAGLTIVSACSLCLVMQRKQLDVPFGALPIAGALVAYVGGEYLGGVPGWVGAVVGLAVGALVWHHRRGFR